MSSWMTGVRSRCSRSYRSTFAAFAADLAEPAQVPALIDAIRDRFGRIAVVEYGPIGSDQGFPSATRLDAATLESLSRLLLFTPVEVVRAVLPEMSSAATVPSC